MSLLFLSVFYPGFTHNSNRIEIHNVIHISDFLIYLLHYELEDAFGIRSDSWHQVIFICHFVILFFSIFYIELSCGAEIKLSGKSANILEKIRNV